MRPPPPGGFRWGGLAGWGGLDYARPMIDAQEIERRILAELPDAKVLVKDLTGGGDHYEVEVISTAFAGMSSLARHRRVYGIFSDVVGRELHALSLKTRTPDEG